MKKRIFSVLITAIVCVCLAIAAGCTVDQDGVPHYTVKFYSEGVEVPASQNDFALGSTVEFPEDPVKQPTSTQRFEFKGWSADENGDEVVVKEECKVTGDANYYAVFDAINIYTVRFFDGDSELTAPKTVYDENESIQFPADLQKAATQTHRYEFKGWATSNGSSETVVKADCKATENINYYAVWETTNIYTVKFMDGTEEVPSAKTTYDEGEKIQFPADPVKEETGDFRYEFAGWSESPSGTDTVNKADCVADGNKTYYAVWTKIGIHYTISGAENTSFVYDGEAHTFAVTASVVSGEEEVSVQYKTDADGEYSNEAPQFTAVGSYTIYYKLTADGYDPQEGSFTVECTKAENSLTGLNEVGLLTHTAVYNGQEISIDLSQIHSDFGEISVKLNDQPKDGVVAIKNAGEYKFDITVAGTANYDGVTESVTITISKADYTAKPQNQSGYTYNGNLQGEKVQIEGVNGEKFDITVDGDYQFTNAGTHTVNYSVTGNGNYNDIESASYTVEIAKKTVTVTGAQTENIEKTYDGNVYTPVKPNVDGLITDDHSSYLSEVKITLSGGDFSGEIKNAGVYTISYTLTLSENYAYDGATKFEYTVTINKAKATKPIDEVIVDGYLRVGGTLNDVALEDGYFWSAPETEFFPTDQNGHKYNAYYNPDKANYIDSDEFTVTVTVHKTTVYINATFEADLGASASELKEHFITDKNGNRLSTDGLEIEITANVTKAVNSYTVGGTYAVDCTGTMTENDYYELNSESKGTGYIKIKSVDVDGTLYTIEDALKIAASDKTITVKSNTSFATADIKKVLYNDDSYYTVKEGVTLLLPYDTTKNSSRGVGVATGTSEKVAGFNGTTQNDKYNSARGNTNLCDLTLNFPDGIEIINNGTLNIGGITSGGAGNSSTSEARAGQTSSGYARLVLGAKSKINSMGTINSLGFIEESSKDNGSQVILNGGSLYMPFVVREHRGGGAFVTMIGGVFEAMSNDPSSNLKTSPFNRFYMENVHAQLIVMYGAAVYGKANLYANETDNHTDVSMIGKDNNFLIQLKENAKAIAKFDTVTSVTALEIKGSLNLNALSLKLECGEKYGIKVSATLHTKAVFFPVSWYYNITLSEFEDSTPATVDATAQKIKIMPGASLTIGKNVTMNASEIVVYDENSINDINDSSGAYEKKNEPSVLIVNGTLNVKNLAGFVQTEVDNAKLIVTEGTTIITSEVSSHSGSGLSAKVNYKDNITNSLTLKMYSEETGSVSEATQQNVGTYTSKNGGWQAA